LSVGITTSAPVAMSSAGFIVTVTIDGVCALSMSEVADVTIGHPLSVQL
jgi:hypothetical protein